MKCKRILFILIIAFPLPAFADTVDYYKIHLGTKQVFNVPEPEFNSSTQFKITLDSSNRKDTIHIFFFHCEKGTTERQVKLADSTGHVLQTWNFHNAEDSDALSIPIERIRRLKKAKPGLKLYLYYYDEQILEGQLLTLLELEKISISKLKNNSTLIRIFLVVFISFLVGTTFLRFKKAKQHSQMSRI